MPPERFPPDDPREWLRQARVDLRVARLAPADMAREPFAFHAQQAAEKALKAVLPTRGIRFPFVHDLERLLELLERNGVYPPGPVRDAGRLTGLCGAHALPARRRRHRGRTGAEFNDYDHYCPVLLTASTKLVHPLTNFPGVVVTAKPTRRRILGSILRGALDTAASRVAAPGTAPQAGRAEPQPRIDDGGTRIA